MKNILGLMLFFSVALTSCEYLENTLPEGLSDSEIVDGLKTALELGADSATSNLHATNGYYLDEAVKILLPPETEIITTNLTKVADIIPGGASFVESQLENLLLSLNRAAEDAADDALPILADAITSLSIQDGWDILHGSVPTATKNAGSEFDSIAATHYLEQQTKQSLITAFSSPINESLNKPLIGSTSTNDIWNSITNTYNTAANYYNNTFGLINPHLELVNADLGEYATEKALNGLFIKVGDEEKQIRRNPWEWSLDIIQRVFGSLFSE